MRPILLATKLRILGLAAALAAPCVAQAKVDYCMQCHEKEAALAKNHVHMLRGVGCADCHGGDPTQPDKDKAKAESTGYLGKIERGAFPKLCGDCHADVERMNPSGLPTDQLARYKASRHGKALFEDNDTKTATCVDCHGSHGILGRKDEKSPVHAKNVTNTCAKCHSDAEFADEHGLEGKEEEEYRRSVHAKMLFEDGDLSAPQCATCHDGHGPAPRGFATPGDACAKCHIKQKELFATSPHAPLVAEGEFNGCVSCHGSHEVRPTGTQILEAVCQLCHENGDKGMVVRDQLLTELTAIERRFESTAVKLKLARQRGFASKDDALLLENARIALANLASLQHSLDAERVQHSTEKASMILARLSERIDAAESSASVKRLALLPVVLFLVLMSLGFYARFRRIHSDDKEDCK